MSWLLDYKAQFSLGILYLSSQLKKMGCEVEIFDSNANDISSIPFSDVYAFSVVYNTYKSSVDLANKIKSKYPDCKCIIGGVHVTTDHENINGIFDSIFIGQSELTIQQYARDLENGCDQRNYEQTGLLDLDSFDADRSLLPLDYIKTSSIFTHASFDDGGSTSIMFSRGCPFKCSFCSSPVLYKRKMAFRSVDKIVEEIKEIIETYGIRQFRIQDDTFTCRIKFVKELTEKLKPLDIFYRCSTRVNVVTEEIIKDLYDSGCREIGLGIEVADNDCLKALNKQITIEQAEKAINIIRKFPIKIRCFFMMGLPCDSEDTMRKNIEFIERVKADNVIVGNFIPFPGNDMYINKSQYGIKSVKENTCMNINKKLPLAPNILRTDISEKKHISIMKTFYNYLDYKGYI